MRTIVGVLDVLLALPWVVACLAFNGAFPTRRQRLGAGLLGLAFGACMVAGAGSLFLSSWRTAAAWVAAAQGAFYGAGLAIPRLQAHRRARAATFRPRAG